MAFRIFFERWQKKQLFWFFQRWLMFRQKTKCAVCALAFLVQMFNCSTIFALCTTSLYMARSVQIIQLVSDEARAEFLNFSYYLFSQ
jgi:hypothetical protein